jgi:hypothetical protein
MRIRTRDGYRPHKRGMEIETEREQENIGSGDNQKVKGSANYDDKAPKAMPDGPKTLMAPNTHNKTRWATPRHRVPSEIG